MGQNVRDTRTHTHAGQQQRRPAWWRCWCRCWPSGGATVYAGQPRTDACKHGQTSANINEIHMCFRFGVPTEELKNTIARMLAHTRPCVCVCVARARVHVLLSVCYSVHVCVYVRFAIVVASHRTASQPASLSTVPPLRPYRRVSFTQFAPAGQQHPAPPTSSSSTFQQSLLLPDFEHTFFG